MRTLGSVTSSDLDPAPRCALLRPAAPASMHEGHERLGKRGEVPQHQSGVDAKLPDVTS